jgi:hypothetical protein
LALLPDESEELTPLDPLEVALAPVPVAELAVVPSLLQVPADEPPVPTVDAPTPLPAVALPPLPIVLLLDALPPVPDAPLAPSVVVVVVLRALRTPVLPSAWRPAAKPLLSVALPALVAAVSACTVIAPPSASAPASAVRISLCLFII